ncbi:RDD family protein [Oceanobacter mangrovi]|uniref:RDD family protein n=1 Tax=Oceanobacter mangrovi TaxID=2862510 RepID=UPI001C8D92B3|nr:RDD family protein [Oceanobacter mangrovi]
MNHWQVLELAPGSDLKAVKQAYARLLKSHKPDEDPQGFARLHKAYKACQAEAKQQRSGLQPPAIPPSEALLESSAEMPSAEPDVTEDASNDGAPGLETHVERQAEPLSVEYIDQPLSTEPDASPAPVPALEMGWQWEETPESERYVPEHQDDSRAARLTLLAATQEALEKTLMQDQPENWRFLETSEALYDLDYKMGFGLYVLEELLGLHKLNGRLLEQRSLTLKYLDQLFDWQGQLPMLEERWDYDYLAPVINVVLASASWDMSARSQKKVRWRVEKEHRGPLVIGNYFTRVAATALDLIGYGVLMSLWLPSLDVLINILIMVGLFPVLKTLLEASPMQGSPGQVLLGLKVVSKSGKRMNPLQAFWRQLMFLLSLVAIKVLIFVNLFIRDGRYLHDRFSGSSVVERS